MSTSVHPVHVPRYCICGHDARSHNLGVAPNTCRECNTNTATQLNQHNFQSPNDLGISPPVSVFGPYFQARDLARTVNAGGGAFAFILRSTTPNTAGQPVCAFSSFDPRMNVGMTMVVFPTNFQNQASYIVRSFDPVAMTVTLDRNIQTNINTFNCLFTGILGSTMGPGRPANGQRAG